MFIEPVAKASNCSAGPETSLGVILSRQIARSLKRRYPWVDLDDLEGYAFLGVALAAKGYKAELGVPFPNHAGKKGMFLAVDEMRRARILRHASAAKRPHFVGLIALDSHGDPIDAVEPASTDSDRDMARLEARDTLASLMGELRPQDRKLLLLHYADGLTFREMGVVLGLSESGVCLRHTSVLARLRHLAGTSQRAGLAANAA